MADSPISGLNPASTFEDEDLFVLEQGGQAKRLSGSAFVDKLLELAKGHGGIASIAKTGTSGLVDTYTITFVDGDDTTFTITNGDGIDHITSELVIPTAANRAQDVLVSIFLESDPLTAAHTFRVYGGTNGTRGSNAYVFFRYADVNPSSDSDMYATPKSTTKWMGVYSGSSPSAPTSYTAYAWFYSRGEKGAQGAQGNPGPSGAHIWRSSQAPTQSDSSYDFDLTYVTGPMGEPGSIEPNQPAYGDILFYGDTYYSCVRVNIPAQAGQPSTVSCTDPYQITANGIPPGGTTDQALIKRSNGDYDVVWASIQSGGGLSSALKTALLQLASKVAYIDDQGEDYYQDLYDALYPGSYSVTNTLTNCTSSNASASVEIGGYYSATITASAGYTLTGATVGVMMGGVDVTSTAYTNGVIYIASVTGNLVISVSAVQLPVDSITAVFTQGANVIYTNDSLDTLKQYLVVTANYSDNTSIVVTSYTLSGTLAEGTSTITVTYGGETDTFTVDCTVKGWLYHFNESFLSSGTEDFGFTGDSVFVSGLFNRKAYSRTADSATPAADRQVAIHANSVPKFPAFGGDYTISFWAKTQYAASGYPFWAAYYQSGSAGSTRYYSGGTVVASGWSAVFNDYNSPANAGYGVQIYSSKINLRISASTATAASSDIIVTPPSGFAFTDWHHYAVTRKGTTVRFFVDGTLILTATANNNTVFQANQVAIGDIFKNSSGATYTDLSQLSTSGVTIQDLYIAEFCKWESAFNPQNITY